MKRKTYVIGAIMVIALAAVAVAIVTVPKQVAKSATMHIMTLNTAPPKQFIPDTGAFCAWVKPKTTGLQGLVDHANRHRSALTLLPLKFATEYAPTQQLQVNMTTLYTKVLDHDTVATELTVAITKPLVQGVCP
jgi:hypothetical protein